MFLNSVSVGRSLSHFRWVLSSALIRLHSTLRQGCVLPWRLHQRRVPAKLLQVGTWIHFHGTAWLDPSSLLAGGGPQVLAPSNHLQVGFSRGPLIAQPIHRASPYRLRCVLFFFFNKSLSEYRWFTMLLASAIQQSHLVIHVCISSLLFFSFSPHISHYRVLSRVPCAIE